LGEYDAETGAPIADFASPTGLNSPASIAISPVPEPETWAFVACGLSLLASTKNFRRFRRACAADR
jgi:hypothetical protein